MIVNPSSLYSEAFFDRQSQESLASARVVLNHAFQIYRPASVVDVGCGVGPWLRAAGDAGVGTLQGIDGDYVPREKLLVPASEFCPADLERDRLRDALQRRFDMVFCLEVAEHLTHDRAASFIDDLCALGDAVFFSAAVPGQGGTGHVNERWPGYWSEHFSRNGFACFDNLRPRLWTEAGIKFWYQQNLLYFARRGTRAYDAMRAAGPPTLWPRALIHPGSGRPNAALSASEMPFSLLIPVCNETLAFEFSSYYFKMLGVDPLYVIDQKAPDHARRIVENSGNRFAFYVNDKPFIEHGYESFAAQSPTDWMLRLDCDEVANVALFRLGEAYVREGRSEVIQFERDQLLLCNDGALRRATNDRFLPERHIQSRLFNRRQVAFDKRIHTPGIHCDHVFKGASVGRIYHFSWIFLTHADRLAKSSRYDDAGQPAANRENQTFPLDEVSSASMNDAFLSQIFAEWCCLIGQDRREHLTKAQLQAA